MKKKLFLFLSILVLVIPFGVFAEDPAPSADPTQSPEPSHDPVEIKITVSPSSMELKEGESKKIEVELEGASSTVIWKSSDDSVATVDDGKVTAKKAGTATITATVEGKSANCAVTVKAAEKVSATLKSIKIAGAEVTKVDDNNYNVTVTDESNFNIVDDGKHVIISLSDESAKYSMTSLDAKNEFKILVGDNTYTFKVKKPEANTYLSKLEVVGYAFDQAFNKDTTSYTVTVPYDITTVTINANPEDSNAKVSTGTSFTKDNLQVGGNTITIKVTNGSDSRTYKVFVTREEESKEKNEKTTSGITSKITSDDSEVEIPETTSPDSILDYIIITLGTLVLFSIGGIGIYFYVKTSPKRMKKELLKKKENSEKEESPIVEINEVKPKKEKAEIKDFDNDIEEL